MATKFPAEIDTFDLRLPEELIKADHINNIQDAIVAIEVFSLSMNDVLEGHINQATGAHAATAISVVNIPDLDSINVQTSLQDLKSQLDAKTDENSSNAISALNDHINEDINLAHPQGELPGGRLVSQSVTGAQIAPSTIDESHLSFDIVSQPELDQHINTPIADAHQGTFPISRLDTDVATQAELDAHINQATAAHAASAISLSPTVGGENDVQSGLQYVDNLAQTHIDAVSGVHGIDSFFVGTDDVQALTNKRYLSDFVGPKIVLWTADVADTILDPYKTDNSGSANQIELFDGNQNSLFSLSQAGKITALDIEIQNNASLTGSIDIEGSLTVEQGLVSNSDSTIRGNIVGESNLDIAGAISGGSLDVTGGISGDSITLNKGANISSNLEIGGNIQVGGNTSINGKLNVDGKTVIANDISVFSIIATGSLQVDRGVSLRDSAEVHKDLSVYQDLSVSKDTYIAGDLVVDGYFSNNRIDSIEADITNLEQAVLQGGKVWQVQERIDTQDTFELEVGDKILTRMEHGNFTLVLPVNSNSGDTIQIANGDALWGETIPGSPTEVYTLRIDVADEGYTSSTINGEPVSTPIEITYGNYLQFIYLESNTTNGSNWVMVQS